MSENRKPSLKDARVRTNNPSLIQRHAFSLSEHEKTLGQGLLAKVTTYGCQANERDSETILGILREMGYQIVEDESVADLIILNTCAIRQNAEDRAFGELGFLKQYKAQKPDLLIGLCGCMAQEESVVEKLEKSYRYVELVFGTHNIHRLPQLLSRAYEKRKRVVEVYSSEGEVIEELPAERKLQHKAWVNIMYGCDKFCTYCIVPLTRGKQRSRLVEDIVKEVEELKASGCKEVTLLGQNVNAYGKDLQMEDGFSRLLEEVAKTGIPRVRFTTSHPWDFTLRTVDVMAQYDNIMPFLHLPVQSGDNEILKIMGRRYTVEQYKQIYDYLKEKVPNCAFSTDIIVGFPNETEEQFQRTLDLYRYCRYDNAYTFIYSPRIGTPAARMEDSTPYEDKVRRLTELNVLVDQYARENNEAYLGREVEVLVDGPSKKNPEIVSGYTRENKLVNFRGNASVGDLVRVRITGCKTWYLEGEVIA